MIGFQIFSSTPTPFDLNGPVLSFTSEPSSKIVCNSGIATFIGIATATFPTQTPPNPAVGLGSISYRWYEVGVGALSDSSRVAGSGTTTLVLSNISSPTDNGRQFYLTADYINSGTTPNAINDILSTTNALLTVYPTISVATQPTSVTTIINNSGTFNVVAGTTDSTIGEFSYNWKLNGQIISDGSISDTVTESATTTTTGTASGYTSPGIYFDLTSFSGNVSVTFTTSEESGIFHYINIPGIKNFPENNGTETFTLSGGTVYGPCSAPNGGLYIGAETPVGGSATLVVEEGGDDWNDMILYANQGYFRRLNSAPETTNATTTTTQTVTRTTTVSGATTPTLTISSNKVGIQTVSCVISHTLACNSPIESNNAELSVVSADSINRSILKYEIVRDDNSVLYSTGEQNIFVSPLNFSSDTSNPSRNIVVYAPEKDINVKITLAGSVGGSFGDNIFGGSGGLSIFEYTLKKNTEYVFKLNPPTNPFGGIGGGGGAAFFYEKGKLLAVCGGGGGASSAGKGGDGGGIGVAGQDGVGRNAGKGGILITAGTLTQNGLSVSGINGGRVESCTIGNYYQSQGIPPCSDIGQQQWRNSFGEIVNGTAAITRGYKAGTSYRNNGGNSTSSENGAFIGGGGSGAVGGNATQSPGSSGGGGSGYTNGSVSIISTRLGGNPSPNSFAIIEIQP